MARRARTPARLAAVASLVAVVALALSATAQAAPAGAGAKAKAAAPAAPAGPAPKCDTECQNGGTCTLGKWSAHPYCVCPDGFAGGACELKGRVCSVERAEAAASSSSSSSSSSSDPRISLLADGGAPTAGATVFCQNGGTCAVAEVPASGAAAGGPLVKRPYCDCSSAPGFSGRFCHVRATRCNSEGPVRECLNGGTCPEGLAAKRESAACACPPEFGGRACELDFSGAAEAGADREGRPKSAAAGWTGPNGKTVGALTVEQELALLAQQGADVHGPGGGLATWQVALIAVGSALGAAAVAGALLAIAVHRKRRAQDRLTREHHERRQRRMRRGPGGSTSGGGGGGRKAPVDEEQPGSMGGGAGGSHGGQETPMASPLAAALHPPARAADQF